MTDIYLWNPYELGLRGMVMIVAATSTEDAAQRISRRLSGVRGFDAAECAQALQDEPPRKAERQREGLIIVHDPDVHHSGLPRLANAERS